MTMTEEQSLLQQKIIGVLQTIYDPEIPVNIYDLGLIYTVDVSAENDVTIQMTLTTPGCPVAGTFPHLVENTVRSVAEVNDVIVQLIWDPPWTQDRMSEAARLQLGLFD